jgi:N-acetylglucosaminyldiphosphoundecaprenol N-acetyl-beta-D-mannosaminyltransferase
VLKGYDYSKPGYICFPDASVVAMAEKDLQLREIINNSFMAMPDGKPSEILAKRKGFKNVSTVSGYWLCDALLQTNLKHYFLGSKPEVLEKIKQNITEKYPNANICGYASPGFYSIEEIKNNLPLKKEIEEINKAKPDIIWVGLSSPKQDYLMHTHLPLLEHGLFAGVGGVFDYLSGHVNKSPEWIKKLGLRWLWRLIMEPKRLFMKYFNVFRYIGWKYVKALTDS